MMYRLTKPPAIAVGSQIISVGDLVEITGNEPTWCASRAALRDGRLVEDTGIPAPHKPAADPPGGAKGKSAPKPPAPPPQDEKAE